MVWRKLFNPSTPIIRGFKGHRPTKERIRKGKAMYDRVRWLQESIYQDRTDGRVWKKDSNRRRSLVDLRYTLFGKELMMLKEQELMKDQRRLKLVIIRKVGFLSIVLCFIIYFSKLLSSLWCFVKTLCS